MTPEEMHKMFEQHLMEAPQRLIANVLAHIYVMKVGTDVGLFTVDIMKEAITQTMKDVGIQILTAQMLKEPDGRPN